MLRRRHSAALAPRCRGASEISARRSSRDRHHRLARHNSRSELAAHRCRGAPRDHRLAADRLLTARRYRETEPSARSPDHSPVSRQRTREVALPVLAQREAPGLVQSARARRSVLRGWDRRRRAPRQESRRARQPHALKSTRRSCDQQIPASAEPRPWNRPAARRACRRDDRRGQSHRRARARHEKRPVPLRRSRGPCVPEETVSGRSIRSSGPESGDPSCIHRSARYLQERSQLEPARPQIAPGSTHGTPATCVGSQGPCQRLLKLSSAFCSRSVPSFQQTSAAGQLTSVEGAGNWHLPPVARR